MGMASVAAYSAVWNGVIPGVFLFVVVGSAVVGLVACSEQAPGLGGLALGLVKLAVRAAAFPLKLAFRGLRRAVLAADGF